MNRQDVNKQARDHDVAKLSREEEREWRLQEQALHHERTAETVDDAPLLAQYRLVAHALRQESSAVPADFTASVLSAVHASPVPASAGLERWLLRGLFAVFVLSGLVVAALYGGQWLQGFALLWSQTPATTHNWLLALGACIALSWSLRLLKWPDARSSPE